MINIVGMPDEGLLPWQQLLCGKGTMSMSDTGMSGCLAALITWKTGSLGQRRIQSWGVRGTPLPIC